MLKQETVEKALEAIKRPNPMLEKLLSKLSPEERERRAKLVAKWSKR